MAEGPHFGKLPAALLALALWQAASLLINDPLLLAGPWEVGKRLAALAVTPDYWQTIAFSLSRIVLGFLLGFATAAILALFCIRFPWAQVLLEPYMAAAKTVPVASFIVMALLWLSGRRLSVFISFLMVLPVLYSCMIQGLKGADEKLLEMVSVFRLPRWQRFRGVYLPSLTPHILAGCRSCLGLCWKAGVAAEVIAVCPGSLGGMLYDAKIYLEMDSLLAWTCTIVAVSGAFEKCFLHLLTRGLGKLEGR